MYCKLTISDAIIPRHHVPTLYRVVYRSFDNNEQMMLFNGVFNYFRLQSSDKNRIKYTIIICVSTLLILSVIHMHIIDV
jgi:hypothetical protein